MAQARSYPQILSRLLDSPLMLTPNVAAILYNVLAGRLGNATIKIEHPDELTIQQSIRASRFTGDMVSSDDPSRFPKIEPFKRTPEGIGVITVDGELINRGAWIGADSGLVSYEGVKFQLARAARDPKTRAILLDINSPGGEAIGAAEVASAVRQAASAKPVWAVANGLAASAAYALASGATRIVAAPSSMTGSIGVVALHLDASRAMDAAGITPTLIYAGQHKVDGNSFEPLTDGVLADLQAEINKFYEGFIQTVAEGRGRRMSVKAARATEARTYLGADAVAIGLADLVGTFEDALGELTAKTVRASLRRISQPAAAAAQPGGPKMAENYDTETETAIREAREQARSQALAEGQRLGAEAASGRVLAILADERVKGHEAYALKLAAKAPALTAADIGEMCAELPTIMHTATLGAQVSATGVNSVAAGPLPPGAVQQIRDGGDWDKSIEKINARITRAGAR